jgi:hypothetical protein
MSFTQRVQWQQVGGCRVLVSDYHGLDPDAWIEQILLEHKLVLEEPEDSVLLLSDFSGARLTPGVVAVLSDTAQLHSDRIRASVVVGTTAIMRLAVSNASRGAGREVQTVGTRQEAFRYLLGRAPSVAA